MVVVGGLEVGANGGERFGPCEAVEAARYSCRGFSPSSTLVLRRCCLAERGCRRGTGGPGRRRLASVWRGSMPCVGRPTIRLDYGVEAWDCRAGGTTPRRGAVLAGSECRGGLDVSGGQAGGGCGLRCRLGVEEDRNHLVTPAGVEVVDAYILEVRDQLNSALSVGDLVEDLTGAVAAMDERAPIDGDHPDVSGASTPRLGCTAIKGQLAPSRSMRPRMNGWSRPAASSWIWHSYPVDTGAPNRSASGSVQDPQGRCCRHSRYTATERTSGSTSGRRSGLGRQVGDGHRTTRAPASVGDMVGDHHGR